MRREVLVTVIMGVYNQHNREELEAAVVSIENQTMQDWELIICDDGSDGLAAENLKSYEGRDERIRIIRHEQNQGLAATLNTCIQKARGRYIARMDADDISDPARLQRQFTFLEENPEYDFVGCNAVLIDEKGVWGYRRMPEHPEKKDFLAYSPFIHPSVMVRREVYIKSGGYYVSRETWRCEDYELFMRLYAQGYSGYNMQEALFYYREGRLSYQKRRFRYRVDEAKIRHRNFKNLGVSPAISFIYTVRPIVGGLIPREFLIWLKRNVTAGVRRTELIRGEKKRDGYVQNEGIPKMVGEKTGAVGYF